MSIYYQFGIIIGLVLLAFAIHIAMKQHKTTFPFNIVGIAFIISTLAIYIIVACLGAIQPQNWYTNNALWKFLIAS